MALYSHKHKLLYYHIYKTGGMSVRTAMSYIDNYCLQIIKGHADVSDVKNYFENNNLNELYKKITKFSVVRNPYTWVYSLYNFSKSLDTHPFHEFCINHTFEEFILWYIEYTPFFNANPAFNGKIQKQTDYICINGIPQVKYILKYEDLDSQFVNMMNDLQIDFPHPFPKINETDYEKPTMEYFILLDRNVLNIFNAYFHDDFVTFNYKKV